MVSEKKLRNLCKTCHHTCNNDWLKIKLDAGIDYCIHHIEKFKV